MPVELTAGKRIHLVGLGGAGMSALAWVLLGRNCQISGSDLQDGPPLDRLRRNGAEVRLGHGRGRVSNADLVIYSSAVPPDNVELEEAQSLGVPVASRGEAVARLVSGGRVVAVAGSHGKTTTTAMVARVMCQAGFDPTILVGGELDWLKGNARVGHSDWFVVEADESDGSFLALRPTVGVVTNIEDDHLDHYGSLQGIQGAFRRFANGIRTGGFLVKNIDCPVASTLAAPDHATCIDFGQTHPAWVYGKIRNNAPAGSRVQVCWGSEEPWMLKLQVPGTHNISNALAAVAVARALGIAFPVVQEALGGFRSARRRFEHLGRVQGIDVVDDYAHHPTEVAATVETGRLLAERRLIVVFQPHRYSRTRQLAERFGSSCIGADMVVVTDVYAAGESPLPGISGQTVSNAMAACQDPATVHYVPNLQEIPEWLLSRVQAGDLVLTLGAGNVREVGERLVQLLSRRAGVGISGNYNPDNQNQGQPGSA